MQGIDAKELLAALVGERADSEATAATVLADHLFAAHAEDEVACPPGARNRAYGLMAQAPQSLWETVARLVFDSWSGLAPAARSLGTDRLLRFETALGAVDVQVGRDPLDDAVRVAIAAEVEQANWNAVVEVGKDETPLALDADGTGSDRLPADVNQVVVVIRDEMGELLRTPAISTR